MQRRPKIVSRWLTTRGEFSLDEVVEHIQRESDAAKRVASEALGGADATLVVPRRFPATLAQLPFRPEEPRLQPDSPTRRPAA